jgi:hypothetical protein
MQNIIKSVASNHNGYSRVESPVTSINQASAKHIHLGIKWSLNAVLKNKDIGIPVFIMPGDNPDADKSPGIREIGNCPSANC